MRHSALVRATCCAALVALGFGPALAQDSSSPKDGLYAGRFDPDRHERMDADQDEVGPNAQTREALDRALRWLAESQLAEGAWSPAAGGEAASMLNQVGLSGLALLAFLGDGNTQDTGPYKQVVGQGLRWLRSIQVEGSGAFGAPQGHTFLYNHGIATLAICEALRLTEDDSLRAPAQAAVGFVQLARNPYGAWRYDVPPIGDNDTSVTGWMVLALKTAEAAGLEVDANAFQGARNWIEEVTDPETGRVGYDSRGSVSSRIRGINDHFPADHGEAMTAVGLHVRRVLGDRAETHPVLEKHARRLLGALPEWDPEGLGCDMYYWYFGTLSMRGMGGEWWTAWEACMRAALLPAQRTDSGLAGSWDPVGPWGAIGGRVYSTALMALCLEAYWTVTPDPPAEEVVAEEPAGEPTLLRHSPLHSTSTESARAGARWLRGAQTEDGSWRSGEPPPIHAVGTTGLAVLALLGDDSSDEAAETARALDRAIRWLVQEQDAETGRIGPAAGHTFMYDHAIATLALCEHARRSPDDDSARRAAQRAVTYACKARNPYGAWRYSHPPLGDNDTSVTGWMLRALKSAEAAGLRFDQEAFNGGASWIDAVTDPESGRVGYDSVGSRSSRVPGINDRFSAESGEAMTAVGLSCRLLLGQDPIERSIIMRHAELLVRTLPEWDASEASCDMYYWYHGTLAMRAMGGRHWDVWRHSLERALLPHQVQGEEEGSWDPVGPWGYAGGRVYSTALMTLALQDARDGGLGEDR